jgi:hypothetical protein
MSVMSEFGVAQVPATLGLTLYVAGYGLGPIIWSPMSEIPQVGRLWVYMGTLCMYAPEWVSFLLTCCSRVCPVPATYHLLE